MSRLRPLPAVALFAGMLAAALCVAGCGDEEGKKPVRPVVAPGLRPPPFPGAPLASYYDDQRLVDDVFDAAKTHDRSRLLGREFPPRVSRMRAAVGAVHELLLGKRVSAPSWEDLFAALDALAEGDEVLAGRLAVWRVWTESERRLEASLAARARTGLTALAAVNAAKAPDLSGYANRVVEAPPESPAAARLAGLRLAWTALSAPTGKVDPHFTHAVSTARVAFDGLEWPAEFGRICELIAFQVARDAPRGLRFLYVVDAALDGYARGENEFLAARLYLRRARMDAAGDPRRALKLVVEGMRRMELSGARGREPAEAHYLHGQLLQRNGRQQEAAEAFRKALEESIWARQPEPYRVPVREALATSLVRSGQFAEAERVAREAAELYDEAGIEDQGPAGLLRASLDATLAVCLMHAGDHLDAAEFFRLAAVRYDRVAGADANATAARERDRHTLLCARELAAAGSVEDAQRHIASVVERDGVSPASRAAAAGVLLDAGLPKRAREQLVRAEREGGPRFAAGLTELRGRLFAKTGEPGRARGFFRKALRQETRDGKRVPAGPKAARIHEAWADMEEAEGELAAAADHRLRALAHLSLPGFSVEKDQARAALVRLQRRRGWYRDAHTIAVARLSEKLPRSASARQDLLLDRLFVEIELALAGEKGRAKSGAAASFAAVAEQTAQAFPDGPAREIALRAVQAVRGDTAAAAPPDSPEERLARLRRVVLLARSDAQGDELAAEAIALAANLGDADPELRRWAARIGLAADGVAPERMFALVELRRRAEPATFEEVTSVLGGRESLLLIEPCGAFTVVLQMGTTFAAGKVDADAALREFWSAANTEPSKEKLALAAQGLADAVFGKIGDLSATDVLCVSLGAPLGPLPFDLIPHGDGTLLDHAAVTVVADATERARAARLPSPEKLRLLDDPRGALVERQALVQPLDRGPKLDEAEQDALRGLLLEALEHNPTPAAALRAAKIAYRKQWKGDRRVPAWALLVLRGAPF